jgi:hypothetical protein
MAKIFRSSVIKSSIDNVWANALPEWHPAFVDSHIESDEPGDKVGCIRNFNLKDGGNIRERLLTLSDSEHLCTYTILESPLPVENYVATLRLLPITDGNQTYIEWTAEFNCSTEEEQNMINMIGDGVFLGGFNALKSALEG